MKELVRSVKGTRDFYPDQMAFRTWLYGKVREVSERFGYQEYEGPILERLDLYAAKSGEELVNEQSYVFDDRGGEKIALRPELTPTVARMIAQKQNELARPIRWWQFGPFWRYERPQKGRTREFLQWNIDCIGTDSVYADAELVTVTAELLRGVGLTPDKVAIKINSRALMAEQIKALGVDAELIPGVYRLIDKLGKLSPDQWTAYAQDVAGLMPEQIERLQAILHDRDLWKQSPDLGAFMEAMEVLGSADYLEYDPSIIRGLGYYTGLVFEAWDRAGEFRAIVGGGRYDNLVSDVGGQRLGGIGSAMGDVVMRLVLEKYGLIPELRASPARVLVTVFNDDLFVASARVASELRAAGINTDLYPDPLRLDKQLKYANSLGIPFAVIIGPDEEQAGKAAVKNMVSGEQKVVGQKELAGLLAVGE